MITLTLYLGIVLNNAGTRIYITEELATYNKFEIIEFDTLSQTTPSKYQT